VNVKTKVGALVDYSKSQPMDEKLSDF